MGIAESNKKWFVALGMLTVSIIVYIIYAMKVTFKKDSASIERGCDAMGCGEFGASRGDRKHNGLDLLFEAWESVYAPFKLKIKRFGKVYASTTQFDLVEFTGFGVFSIFTYKVMYIDTVKTWNVNDIIDKGQLLGNAQDIADYHGGGMKNHIHVEVRVLGKLLNPKTFIKTL